MHIEWLSFYPWLEMVYTKEREIETHPIPLQPGIHKNMRRNYHVKLSASLLCRAKVSELYGYCRIQKLFSNTHESLISCYTLNPNPSYKKIIFVYHFLYTAKKRMIINIFKINNFGVFVTLWFATFVRFIYITFF